MSVLQFDELLALATENVQAIAIVACMGLIFAILTEQIQILAKYFGALKSKIASGYNNAMKILVMNRLGAVSYFMCISFAIDTGITAGRLGQFFVYTTLTVAVLNFSLYLFFYKKYYMVHPVETRRALLTEKRGRESYIIICVLIANSMALFGLTVPMILGATFPTYRLTLANTGFFFNTIFTVINVFIIESYLAKIIDNGTDDIHRIISKILLTRVVATVFVAVVLAVAL